jgi:copper resistance protein C
MNTVLFRTTLATAVVAFAVLAPATAASAHDEVVASTPTEGSTLSQLPDTFSVTMNEDLFETVDGSTNGFGMTITDATGAFYGDGCITIDGPTMSMPAAIGAPGDYTVTWQLVSSDGHPTNGTIHFTWTGDATADGATAASTCGESVSTPAPATAADDSGIATVQLIGVGVGILVLIGGVVLVVMRAKRKRNE